MVAASVAGSTKIVAPTTMPTMLAASAQGPTWRTSPASRWLSCTVPTLARGRAGRHANWAPCASVANGSIEIDHRIEIRLRANSATKLHEVTLQQLLAICAAHLRCHKADTGHGQLGVYSVKKLVS